MNRWLTGSCEARKASERDRVLSRKRKGPLVARVRPEASAAGARHPAALAMTARPQPCRAPAAGCRVRPPRRTGVADAQTRRPGVCVPAEDQRSPVRAVATLDPSRHNAFSPMSFSITISCKSVGAGGGCFAHEQAAPQPRPAPASAARAARAVPATASVARALPLWCGAKRTYSWQRSPKVLALVARVPNDGEAMPGSRCWGPAGCSAIVSA